MKTKWLSIGSIFICLGLLLCVAVLKPVERDSSPAATVGRQTYCDEQTQPVGWVFGRVIGFPGADKPLLPPNGGLGGHLSTPPRSSALR